MKPTQRKKDERKLWALCSKNFFSWWHLKDFTIDGEYEKIKEWKKYGNWRDKERVEILLLFKKLKYTDEDARRYWFKAYEEHKLVRAEYNRKPKDKRQDNKDYYNGNGGSNSNKIRYPKKCRKTAWKRFNKLFPNAKRKK